jgi:predicted transcriptional regulator YdeE
MEQYFLDHDIKVICIRAITFPDGVLAAHQKLHALLGKQMERKYFGISYPEKPGSIIYKAAAEEKNTDEAAQLHCESFTIKKGMYHSIFITNFMQDIPSIGKAFQQLLMQSDIDPDGYCVEMYEGDNDVRCLVPLKKETGSL